MLHLIVYTSRYTGNEHTLAADLTRITNQSKNNNPANFITGLLFYQNTRFLQIIEGDQGVLEGLMSLLEGDYRHEDIQRIIDQPIDRRSYDSWNMDSFNLSADEKVTAEQLHAIKASYDEHNAMQTDVITSFIKRMVMSGPALS